MREEIKAAIVGIVIAAVLIGGNFLLARHMAKPILAEYDELITVQKQHNDIPKKRLEELQLENVIFGIKPENEEFGVDEPIDELVLPH